MTLRQTSARLMLSAAILICAGCTSRNGRSPFTKSGDEVLPTHNRAQLLAAARQYEKEGKSENAIHYYRQVLALDPQNVEAKQGLHLVQSGRLRTETGYDEIVAAAEPKATPRLRTRDLVAKRQAQIDERTARLIAEAAATAQRIESDSEPTNLVTIASAGPTVAAPSIDRKTTHDSRAETEGTVPVETLQRDAIKQADAVEPENPERLNVEVVTVTPVEPEFSATGIDIRSRAEPQIVSKDSEQTPTLASLCEDANAAVLREVAKLDSDDPATRKAGLQALAQMGADASSAATPVHMLLADEHEMVRAYAAWAAQELSDDAFSAVCVKTLTELLGSDDSDVVQFAVYTLASSGEEAQSAVPALNQLLHSSDELVRLHAAEALIRIAPAADCAEAIETLILLTAEPSPQIRSLALTALGPASKQPTKQMTTALTSALHDHDAGVRAAAALALGGFTEVPQSTVAQLKFVADSDQDEVRHAAATALECISR